MTTSWVPWHRLKISLSVKCVYSPYLAAPAISYIHTCLSDSGMNMSTTICDSNSKKWCCESALLNMPANLENVAMATGLENVTFPSNPKEGQCQRTFKLLHNCTHLTCWQSNAQHSGVFWTSPQPYGWQRLTLPPDDCWESKASSIITTGLARFWILW